MSDYGNLTIPYNSNPAVFVTDIADTLRCASNDLARQRQFRLCVHSNINMFSLKKPVPYMNYFPNRANDEWCKGTAMNYGIVIPAPSNTDYLPNSRWLYDKPTGGDRAPFRLYDFVGYRHKCPTPYYVVPSEMYTNKDLQNNKVTACYPLSESGSVGFDKYKNQLIGQSGAFNFYAAIFVQNASNDGGYIRTHHSPIGGSEDKIEFDHYGLPSDYQQGVVKVCCCIASQPVIDWTSALDLPLDVFLFGGYGVVNYTTYLSTYKYPAELISELDRQYTFIDMAETVYIIVRNTRNDGKSIDLRDGVTSNAKIKYEVTSATGDTASVSQYGCPVVAGNAVLEAGQTCTLRFDRMLGYTENGQQAFPPSGFRGNCYATLWYQRRNDIGTSTWELLANINIPLIATEL